MFAWTKRKINDSRWAYSVQATEQRCGIQQQQQQQQRRKSIALASQAWATRGWPQWDWQPIRRHWMYPGQIILLSARVREGHILKAQCTTVHDGLLHPHLRHCSSPASAVRQMPSAVRTATPAFDVRSSRLFCSRPGGLELVITRLPARSVTFLWQFSPRPENFSFLVLLAYTAHYRLCHYAPYKSTLTLILTLLFLPCLRLCPYKG